MVEVTLNGGTGGIHLVVLEPSRGTRPQAVDRSRHAPVHPGAAEFARASYIPCRAFSRSKVICPAMGSRGSRQRQQYISPGRTAACAPRCLASRKAIRSDRG